MMSYAAITIAAVTILATETESPEKLVKWLNNNRPLLGGGTIKEFDGDICADIIDFAKRHHPEFCAWVTGFREDDKKIVHMTEFLIDGGLKEKDQLPGYNPYQEMSYDALMSAANALSRAAGGDINPIPRNGSFVRTEYTQYLDEMEDAYGPDYQGYSHGYGQGGYGGGYGGGRRHR